MIPRFRLDGIYSPVITPDHADGTVNRDTPGRGDRAPDRDRRARHDRLHARDQNTQPKTIGLDLADDAKEEVS